MMPQNHVQTHAQIHGRVCPPKNSVQKKFPQAAAPDLEHGGLPSPYDPLATPSMMYKGCYRPPMRATNHAPLYVVLGAMSGGSQGGGSPPCQDPG